MTFELCSCICTIFSSQSVSSTSWIFASCLWTYAKVTKMSSCVPNKWTCDILLMIHVIVKTTVNDNLNFVVVVVLFLVLKVYELNLEYLLLVSGLTQKYQKCHLECQTNGAGICFSHIKALVWPIICYMNAIGTMKHEYITETLTEDLKIRNVT